MIQRDLFPPAKEDLSALADKWILENPELFRMFREYALRLARVGARFGFKMIAERVRYEAKLKKKGEFKINNSHVAYIGRRVIERHPILSGYIETRQADWAERRKA